MPELDPSNFDPAILLTMAGGTIAAGIVASVVEALKKLPFGIGPWIDAKREPGIATLASFAVIGAAWWVTYPAHDTLTGFGAFVAALGVAAIAGKSHDVVATVTSK